MTTNLYDRLAKVTLHEVGHAFGLPHCKLDPTCLMSYAEGLGKTVGFCTRDVTSKLLTQFLLVFVFVNVQLFKFVVSGTNKDN